jgi:nucleoside-diphosphate-sugar epimerase
MSTPKLVVALLGSDGFIGRHIAESCVKAGISFVDLERWDGESEHLATQIQKIRESNPNARIVLIQAAWYSTSNSDYRTSLENKTWAKITKSVIEICIGYNVIFAGLGTCLEKLGGDTDFYTSSKSEIREFLSKEFPNEEWFWFQIFYVFSREFLKPALIAKAENASKHKESLELSTPYNTHDFIEVRDAAEAIVHALIKNLNGIIEIGTGQTTEVSFLINSLFPEVKILKIDPSDSRISYQYAAAMNGLKKSGWEPKFSI